LTGLPSLWLSGQDQGAKALSDALNRTTGQGRNGMGSSKATSGSGRSEDHPGDAGVAAKSRVSLEAEIPELLFDGMRDFIRSHPHWDQYQLVSSALASFLFQNGCTDGCVTQHYLNGLFMRSQPPEGRLV